MTIFNFIFQFNPECKISKNDPCYNDDPTASDKVHIMVCVIDANKVSLMKNDVVETLRDIRDEASELGETRMTVYYISFRVSYKKRV